MVHPYHPIFGQVCFFVDARVCFLKMLYDPVSLVKWFVMVFLFPSMLKLLEGRICERAIPGLEASREPRQFQAEHNEGVCWDPSCVEIASGKALMFYDIF